MAKVIDSLGRATNLTHSSTQTSIAFTGANGALRTVIIKYDSLSNRFAKDDAGAAASTKTMYELFGTYGGSTLAFNPIVVSEVDLPNGQTYKFRYDSYGELAQVTLPTGGQYRYYYAATASVVGTLPDHLNIYHPVSAKATYSTGSDDTEARSLLEKIEYSVSYSATTPGSLSTKQTVVTATTAGSAAGVLAKDSHSFYSDPRDANEAEIPFLTWYDGREFQTQLYDRNGTTVLRTQDLTWAQRPCATASGEVCMSAMSPSIPYPNDPRVHRTTQY